MPENSRPGKTWALILAAGRGRRLSAATGGLSKQFLYWQGVPLYWHAARAMSRSAVVDGIIFVFPPGRCAAEDETLRALQAQDDLGLPWLATAGGALRQDSVRLGLAALPHGVRHVLVHDAARPFLSPALTRRICEALRQGASAAIPGVPVTDTIKMVDDGLVTSTLPRSRLAAVQTPQGFDLPLLRQAHRYAQETGLTVTDDAALMEALGHGVHIVPGEVANVKITNPEDLALLSGGLPVPRPCTGMGYDVHRYGPGRPLKLGGVPIPEGPEVVAHSDGDVLLHALMDALLGCAGLGDIGRHFPDSQARFEGISSAVLLDHVLEMLRQAKVTLCHADLTIVAQKPRLSPFREEIRKNVARLLGLDKAHVNLKATTEEGLGFTGRVEGIKAYAVVSALSDAAPSPFAFAPSPPPVSHEDAP